MAQYAVLIYADDSAHAPEATAEDTEVCDEHADELASAGSMIAAYALTKEIVAGFYVIEAPDLDAALAVAGTNPVIRQGGGVEVRPVHSGGMVERPDR